MDEFTEGIEVEGNVVELPEIPEGFTRVTHVTLEDVAQRFIQGEDFSYKSMGNISFVTDSFLNNQDVTKLITDGKVGAFIRIPRFGDSVVIMDIENEEYKKRYRVGYCYDNSVPNHNILGYVHSKAPNILHENPLYDPKINQLSEVPQYKGPIRRVV